MKRDRKIELVVSDQEFFRVESIEAFGQEPGHGWELVGTLSVAAGCLRCCGHQYFSFNNLAAFLQDLELLYRDLKGKARLGHTYELDYIEFEGDAQGQIRIVGYIRPFPEKRDQLDFTISCDQTYLPALIQSVKRVLGELQGG